MSEVEDLTDTLALERIEENLYRGVAPQGRGPRIFGGHVIAQALLAAYRTVEERLCHSLHCYFIRPGDPNVPILFQVDRARDGKSFTTRRVTAIQHGQQIFNFAASFQVDEPGLEHQEPMPEAPGPETLRTEQNGVWQQAIEMRWAESRDQTAPPPEPPTQQVWMRARAPLPLDAPFQQAALAYATDLSLIATAMRPHGLGFRTPGLQVASLDHAIWFHRPVRFNAWHLYAQRSPSASGARGFNLGEIYDADGRLVASTAQEGLMRVRPVE